MNSHKYSRKTWFILTGCAIILMAFVAGFAYGFVHASIYRVGDAALTATLLQENIFLYKLEISAWIIILILDLIVSIGLYAIYKETHKVLAIVASSLRVIYTLFLGFAITQLLRPLMSDVEIINSLQFFQAFEHIWSIGLIIFGFHLLALAALCLRSNFTPKFWGVLLAFGGACYVLVHVMKSFFPDLSEITLTIESILMAPMALSEIGFAVWLLVSAIRFKNNANYDVGVQP